MSLNPQAQCHDLFDVLQEIVSRNFPKIEAALMTNGRECPVMSEGSVCFSETSI
jgi:hypothetical protein